MKPGAEGKSCDIGGKKMFKLQDDRNNFLMIENVLFKEEKEETLSVIKKILPQILENEQRREIRHRSLKRLSGLKKSLCRPKDDPKIPPCSLKYSTRSSRNFPAIQRISL